MAPKAKKAASGSTTFENGTIVLGKVKGYPPWPAKVVDAADQFLLPDAKTSKNKASTLLIKYYGTGDFQWVSPKELSALSPAAIDSFISGHKKGGGLKEAYVIAKDPADWEAKSLEKQRKALEKFEAGDDDEEEDEEFDEEADSKKRKRASKPKASSSKKSDAPKKKAKKDKDENLEPGAKQCREWRNKLQKNFIDKNNMPVPEAMPEYDKVFTAMEKFKPQAEWLFSAKLHKVVKRIAVLDRPIPRDDEFKIKVRAAQLCEKWKPMLHSYQADAEDDDAKPNGDAADEKPAEQVDEKPAEVNGTTEPVTDAAKEAVEEQKIAAKTKVEDEPETNGVTETATEEPAPTTSAAEPVPVVADDAMDTDAPAAS